MSQDVVQKEAVCQVVCRPASSFQTPDTPAFPALRRKRLKNLRLGEMDGKPIAMAP
jgi:hypothetical protein